MSEWIVAKARGSDLRYVRVVSMESRQTTTVAKDEGETDGWLRLPSS